MSEYIHLMYFSDLLFSLKEKSGISYISHQREYLIVFIFFFPR